MLAGYKTYLTVAIAIAYALAAHFLGSSDPGSIMPQMAWSEVIQIILAAAGAAGIRSGLASEVQNVLVAMGIDLPKTPNPLDVRMKAAMMGLRSSARRAAPMLAVGAFLCFSLLGGLSACATAMTPQQTLNAVGAGFALAEATYDSICLINSPPGFCTDPGSRAAYAKAKLAVQDALSTAQAALDVSGGVDSAAIEQLIVTLQQDWNDYNKIVNSTKAKAKSLGIKFREA